MEGEAYIKDSPLDTITCLKYSSNSDDLLCSSWDSTISLYDGYTNHLKFRYHNKAAVLTADFSQDEKSAFVGGLEKKVKKIDFKTEEEVDIGHHDEAVS